MPQDFYSKLEKLLKKDYRFVDQDGDLLKSNVIDCAYKADRKLIELLLENKEVKNILEDLGGMNYLDKIKKTIKDEKKEIIIAIENQ